MKNKIILSILVFLTALFVGAASAQASCVQRSIKQYTNSASAVFQGKVSGKKVDDSPSSDKVVVGGKTYIDFEIQKTWKGLSNESRTIQVSTAGMNYVPFEEGEEYIVFASKSFLEEELSTDLCTGTRTAENFASEVALGEPEYILDSETGELVCNACNNVTTTDIVLAWVLMIVLIIFFLLIGLKFIKAKETDKARYVVGILSLVMSAIFLLLIIIDLIW